MWKNIIYRTHQHFLVPVIKTLKIGLLPSLLVAILTYILVNLLAAIALFLIILLLFFWYYFYFWKKSYLAITNNRVYMDVRNWIFSKFNISIHFSQIKDIAYSKNNFLHSIFDYGVLFIRSSAGAEGNFISPDIPNIEFVYNKINYLYSLKHNKLETNTDNKTKEQTINEVITKLLSIHWIKEAIPLNLEEKQHIKNNEEQRNFGVHEAIKREVTLAVTHDSNFREPDAPIVIEYWNNVIFPPVSFHEINQKNIVSSSPWVQIHQYLVPKFYDIDENDATLLIGFDFE